MAAARPSASARVAADLCGFPNGRRLLDDVTDIELRALVEGYGPVLNAVLGVPNRAPNNLLGDGVDENDMAFLSAFPYAPTPQPATSTPHHHGVRNPMPSHRSATNGPGIARAVRIPRVVDSGCPAAAMMRGHGCTSVSTNVHGLGDVSDFEQLVRASRLYYELGETQHAIAELLGVTRPQVSRLLKRARAEGIVEIRIVDSTAVESPAADDAPPALRSRRRPPGADDRGTRGPDPADGRPARGRGPARRASDRARSSAIGDGAFVSATADALEEAPRRSRSPSSRCVAGSGRPGRSASRTVGSAEALGGQVTRADGSGARRRRGDEDGARATRRRPGDRRSVGSARRRAVRDRRSGVERVAGRRAGRTRARGVGRRRRDPRRAVRLDGRFVCPALRDRVIAFDARRLGGVPIAIGVAAGDGKVRPILGALRAGASVPS